MALTKVSTGVVDMSSSTGALEIAKGATTAVAAPLGTLRANTTTNKMEVYASTGWRVLKEGGGIIAPLTVDYLVVAGGGGGGPGYQAAGGGAGGFRTSFGTGNINGGLTAVESTLTLAVATSYSVTIGAPGAGGAGTAMSAGRGATGSSSFFSDGNTTFEILTIGGGGGASYNNYGQGGLSNSGSPGGSGGGAAPYNAAIGVGNGGIRVTTPVQGFNGGNATNYLDPYFGGGGGGAGGVGQEANGANTGNGGVGLQSSITGSSTFYAAGGAGGAYYSYLGGPNAAASGIGGSGAAVDGSRGGNGFTAPGNGTVNTGSGGGGGADNGQVGGDGGSGVVILRYPKNYQITFTNGASPIVSSNASVGTDIVTTITSGTGGTITFS
jgi:hypothetical protein